MPGLDPGIQLLAKSWIAGSSGAKTTLRAFRPAMTTAVV
jgi:hypothetical protein